MSATPFPKREIIYGSKSLLESTTTLAALGTVQSNIFDAIDFLQARHSSKGFGGTEAGTVLYDYNPAVAHPHYFLDYEIYAEGAGSTPAPGMLHILGAVHTPATPPVNVGLTVLKQICLAGQPAPWSGAVGTGPDKANWGQLTGSLRLSARRIWVQYANGAVAQTLFRLGVYLRAA